MAASLKAQGITFDEILSHHGLQWEDVDKECSQGIRFQISIKIINWKMIGRCFGIPEEKLVAIEVDNRTEEERRVVLLHTWHQREGRGATYLKLMTALYQQHKRNLVDQLCGMIKSCALVTKIQQASNGSEVIVKIRMNKLENRFITLHDQLKSELLQKNTTVETVLESLTLLPMEFKLEYDESIQAKLPEVEKATTIKQLFNRLNPLFVFIDYRLLKHITSKFGTAQLKADMTSYANDVQEFMSKTTVGEVMPHWPGRKTSSSEFFELWVKIEANPETYTLQKLNEFRDKYCATIKLSAVLSSIKSLIPAGSFFAVWFVPRVAAIGVTKAVDFYKAEKVSMVILDNKLLYLSDSTVKQLQLSYHRDSDLTAFDQLLTKDQNPSSCRNPVWALIQDWVLLNKHLDAYSRVGTCVEDYATNEMFLTSRTHPGFRFPSRTLMALSKKDFECSFPSAPLKCTICEFILREPHTVGCCEQNFCKNCISEVKQNHGNCPSCTRPDFVHSPNKDLYDVLLQFEVYCTNVCGWKGLLKVHDRHLNINPPNEKWLEGCTKVEVQCIYCKSEVKQRQDLLKYLEKVLDQSKVEAIITITSEKVHTKWIHLGDELSLDSSTIDEIRQKNENTQDCYIELLQKWITTTGTANWLKLLQALRNPAVGFKTLSMDVERSIVCDKASEQEVKRLTEETKAIKKEYHTQQNQLELWAAELESRGSYLEDKKKELEQLKLSCKRTKLQGKVGEELSRLKEQLKLDEEKISSIANELQEGIQEKKKLIKQITEGERQLKNTKDRINNCKIRLEKEIKHLEWEENVKLLGRGLGKSDRIPYIDQILATANIGKAAGIGGTAGAVLGVAGAGIAGGVVLVPVGAAAGVAIGVANYLLNSERKIIEVQYTRLIKTCNDDIEQLKSVVADGEEQLQKLKQIVKKSVST